jgi:hypothetical protein
MEIFKKRSAPRTSGILSLTVKFGEGIDVGNTRIVIEHQTCTTARLFIKANDAVPIKRWRKLFRDSNRFSENETEIISGSTRDKVQDKGTSGA